MANTKWSNYGSIFLISAGTLVFEIILARIFAITFWHHFASLLIALALAGFGTAGSVLVVLMPLLNRNRAMALGGTCLLAGLSMLAAYPVMLMVGLEPLALGWSLSAWLDLGLVCLILLVPFLFAAAHIGLVLAWTDSPKTAYALNLAGSGFGCLLAAFFSARYLPHYGLYPAAILAMAGFIIQVSGTRRSWYVMAMGLALVVGVGFLFPINLQYELFKDRSVALAARGSVVKQKSTGISGVVEVIGGPAFHFAPGLSLNCNDPLPAQSGIFIDGDLSGVLFNEKIENSGPGKIPGFVKCLLTRMPFEVLRPKKVLIINPEGTLGMLVSAGLGSEKIIIIENNPQVFRIISEKESPANVEMIQADPLDFLKSTAQKFDLIMIGQGTRWGPGSESGLGIARFMDISGLKRVIKTLSANGVLAMAGPLMNPPRASLKLIATAGKALQELERDSGAGLIVARDWSTALLLIKPAGFVSAEIRGLKDHAARLGFDLPYVPGGSVDNENRFHVLEANPLAQAAKAAASGRADDFIANQFFNIRPADQDRPYFFNFFRLKILNHLINNPGSKVLAVTDWGLLFSWGGLIAILLLAGVGIFAPAVISGRRPKKLTFFALIGLGYMLAEITLLEEAIYRLGNPALAVPLVIGTFLIASGAGSFLLGNRKPALFAIGAAVFLPITMFGLRFLPGGIITVILVLLPAAFLMGVPFVSGLLYLIGQDPVARGWGFGVNGFFSVAGSLAAVLLCISLGHLVSIVFASGCYLLAAVDARGA